LVGPNLTGWLVQTQQILGFAAWDRSGSLWLWMPMWSKQERATKGSYFAAFATHGTP